MPLSYLQGAGCALTDNAKQQPIPNYGSQEGCTLKSLLPGHATFRKLYICHY